MGGVLLGYVVWGIVWGVGVVDGVLGCWMGWGGRYVSDKTGRRADRGVMDGMARIRQDRQTGRQTEDWLQTTKRERHAQAGRQTRGRDSARTVVDRDHRRGVDAGGGGEEAGLEGKREVDAPVLLPRDALPLARAEPLLGEGDAAEDGPVVGRQGQEEPAGEEEALGGVGQSVGHLHQEHGRPRLLVVVFVLVVIWRRGR